MSIKSLNPYLIFNGDAEQAIRLYERALGARTEGLMRFGDLPDNKIAPEHKSRVMHALLHIGDSAVMVGDAPPDQAVATDGNVRVCVHFGDADDMAKRFDALAAGGKVAVPLHDTFWSAKFGIVSDAFGVRWMFNCSK